MIARMTAYAQSPKLGPEDVRPRHVRAYVKHRLDTASPGGGRAQQLPRPQADNTSPLDDYQHFGELGMDGPTGLLTVDLRDGAGASLWSKTLQPQ